MPTAADTTVRHALLRIVCRTAGPHVAIPPSPADALAAAIADADARSSDASAAALLATVPGTAPALHVALRYVRASLRDALQLLALIPEVPAGVPVVRHGIQATGRALDAAVLVLEGAATDARSAGRGPADNDELEMARRRLLHTLEQQEADLTVRLRDIERFTLLVRRSRLEVASLAPDAPLPPDPRDLVLRLDVAGRIAALRTAVASSHRTVPNLLTLHLDDALPRSLDVHARAIAATAETTRVIDALLDLQAVVLERWPDLG